MPDDLLMLKRMQSDVNSGVVGAKFVDMKCKGYHSGTRNRQHLTYAAVLETADDCSADALSKTMLWG